MSYTIIKDTCRQQSLGQNRVIFNQSSFILKQHLSAQLAWSHAEPRGLSRSIIASAEARAPPQKSPVRFFREAPKIYEMCLHVPLCKRGCRGGIARTEKAGGTHAFSLRESTLLQNNWRWIFFFFSHLSLTRRDSVGLCSRRISFFPPYPFLFFFGHHSARQTERRTARTVGALPSARICFGRCE